jgi:two-component system, OmpR family, sensor histidine kinase KdpD
VKGRLKIFLGYAAGVGKTYQMLTEAQEHKARGEDVVIAYFEPHARAETIALTQGLEVVPRAVYEYRGVHLEEMDTEGVIRRNPKIALVDEFAHTNVPGAPRLKRWEDVMKIREAGIDVFTTVNVQHLECLNDQIWQVTGVRVRETIPDWVLSEADEVVMVDVTPRALLHRLERGVVYSREKAASALNNFFTEGNLTALRELAMRQTAQTLDHEAVSTRDHIAVWITPDVSSAIAIRRARRVADFLRAPCEALYCAADAALLTDQLEFCRRLHLDAWSVEGSECAQAIAKYAHERGATQLFVTKAASELKRLVRFAHDLQVTIIAERNRQP